MEILNTNHTKICPLLLHGWSYTVRKIASYNLYLCRLPRIPCIDTDYNLQIIILIYPATMLCIQLKGWIDTAYQMYLYSIFSVPIQNVLLSSFYGQILDLMISRLTFAFLKLQWRFIEYTNILQLIITDKRFIFLSNMKF